MVSESEINQRWIRLLTEAGVPLGPSKDDQQRYGIGFCTLGLTDAEVDASLAQVFAALEDTRKTNGFARAEIRAQGLQFSDGPNNLHYGVAMISMPAVSRAAL